MHNGMQAQEVAQLAINAREGANAARLRLEGARSDLAVAVADRERIGAQREALQRAVLSAELGRDDEDGASGISGTVTGPSLERQCAFMHRDMDAVALFCNWHHTIVPKPRAASYPGPGFSTCGPAALQIQWIWVTGRCPTRGLGCLTLGCAWTRSMPPSSPCRTRCAMHVRQSSDLILCAGTLCSPFLYCFGTLASQRHTV